MNSKSVIDLLAYVDDKRRNIVVLQKAIALADETWGVPNYIMEMLIQTSASENLRAELGDVAVTYRAEVVDILNSCINENMEQINRILQDILDESGKGEAHE